MSDDTAIVKVDESVRLGSMVLASSSAVVERATYIAKELANIINTRKLYTVISRRKFVQVEGWTTLGAMLGVMPREDSVLHVRDDDFDYFDATVSLIRTSDGAVVGRASAICGTDERTWANRPAYARRSMAVTRATGKAFRLGFSWIMTLAGYEPTPAEEMPTIEGEIVENGHDDDPASVEVKETTPPVTNGKMTLERARTIKDSKGELYADMPAEVLADKSGWIARAITKAKNDENWDHLAELEEKRDAVSLLITLNNYRE